MHLRKLLILAILLMASTGMASAQGVTVMLDGRHLSFDQPPVMQSGRVLVPLRGIFEGLGANVQFTPATREIRATRGNTTVELQLGSAQARVNNNVVMLDVPAQSVQGRTLVPLRFISEALGADVKWVSANRTVLISSTGAPPVSTLPPQPPPTATRPQIDNVIVTSDPILQPGDVLRVVATGTAGGSASFEISGVQSDIAMRETSAGRYEGTLTIPSSMQRGTFPILVSLTRDGLTTVRQAPSSIAIGTSGAPGGPIFVTVTSPTPNSRITGNFNVIGRTLPFALVNVDATLRRPLIPGIINVEQRRVTGQARADQNGSFNVPITVGDVANNTTAEIEVRATDTQGRTSQPVNFTISVSD